MNHLPQGWEHVSLGELLTQPLSNGRSVPTAIGGFPVLRLTAIRDGSVDLSASKSGDWTAAEANKYLVQEGDFLVARGNGTLQLVGQGGLVGTVGAPVAFPDTMIRVRVDPERISTHYLRHLWSSPDVRRQVERRARTTAGIYKINQKDLAAIQVPLPSLEEQRHIVATIEAHLGRLSVATQSLERTKHRITMAATSFRQRAFEGSAELLPLGTVADVVGGIQKQPKRSPKINTAPFLRVANVTAEGLDLSNVHEVELFDGELERYRLEPGDLLVVEGNGSPSQIGRAATWTGEIPDCVHQNHLIRVRPMTQLHPAYLELVWNAPHLRRRLTAVASSTSGLHTLSVAKLKSLLVPVPGLATQIEHVRQFEELRAHLDRLTDVVNASAVRSSALRRTLLSAAFAGHLTMESAGV